MSLHALRQTLRLLWRQRLFSFIQVFGLAIGFAVVDLIVLFIVEELSFDRYNDNYSRIARIVMVKQDGSGSENHFPYAPGALGPALADQLPEIEASARLFAVFNWSVSVRDEPRVVNSLVAVDPSFLDVFTIPFVEGYPEQALNRPDGVIISQSTARRLFLDQPAVGQTITFDNDRVFEVTGVYIDFPPSAHLSLDMIVPFQVFLADPSWDWVNTWYTSTITYLLLKPGVDAHTLTEKMAPIVREVLPKEDYLHAELQPMSEFHLHSGHLTWDYTQHRSDALYILLFGAIGLGVLILALVNFVNLATSRSLDRGGEVGIRKTVGATRRQLVRQFLGEAVILALLAVPLSLLLLEGALWVLRPIADRQLPDLFLAFDLPLLLYILAAAAIGLIAGGYPSAFLASFAPIRNLHGTPRTGIHGQRLRKVLVTFQFTLSLLLFLLAGMVLYQVRYLEQQPLGFNRDNIITLRVTDESNQEDYLPLRDEIIADPGVINACLSQVRPGISTAEDHVIPEGWTGEPITMNMNIVCDRFIKTYGLKIVAGRPFDPARTTDRAGILINQTALKTFGWDSFEGRSITGASGRVFPVIGVIKDYHFMSLHRPVEPQMLIYYPVRGEFLSVRIRGEGMAETLDRVKQIWARTLPDRPFNYSFLDDSLNTWYSNEKRLRLLLTVFSVLALLISSLGIFGLVSHATQRRRPEIGIRKVLGAGAGEIVALLLGEFLLLVGLANLVSWPIAAGLGAAWARNFALQAPPPLWLFPAGAAMTVGLVLLVAGLITWRAATRNPVDAIREE